MKNFDFFKKKIKYFKHFKIMIFNSYKNDRPKKKYKENHNHKDINSIRSAYNKIDNFEAFYAFPKLWSDKNMEGLINVLDYFNDFFRNDGVVDCNFMDENNFFDTLIDILISSDEFQHDIISLVCQIITHSSETVVFFLESEKSILLIQFLIENITLVHNNIKNLVYCLNILYGIIRQKSTITLTLYNMGLLEKIILLLKSGYEIEVQTKKVILMILDKFLENNINHEKEITKNVLEMYRDILLNQEPVLFEIISYSLENFIQKNIYSENSFLILFNYSLFEIIYKCLKLFANNKYIHLEYSFSLLTYGLYFKDDILRKKLVKIIDPSFLLDYLHNAIFEIQNDNLFLSILVLLDNYYTILDETIYEINIQEINEISLKLFNEGNIKLKKELISFLLNILNCIDINFLIVHIRYDFIFEIFHFLDESEKFYPDFYIFLNKLLHYICNDSNYLDIKNYVYDFLNNKTSRTEEDEGLYIEKILNRFYK